MASPSSGDASQNERDQHRHRLAAVHGIAVFRRGHGGARRTCNLPRAIAPARARIQARATRRIPPATPRSAIAQEGISPQTPHPLPIIPWSRGKWGALHEAHCAGRARSCHSARARRLAESCRGAIFVAVEKQNPRPEPGVLGWRRRVPPGWIGGWIKRPGFRQRSWLPQP